MKKGLLLFFGLGILAALATAEDRPAPSSPRSPPVSAAPGSKQTAAAPALPRYVPPARGAPRMRVGAGTRAAGAPVARVEVLSPESVGHTLSASPSLYWHLSQPTQARVDFTLTDEASVAPLVEQTLHGPFSAGMHRIDLTGLGVKLAPGTEYQWYVSLVPDPDERSSDVVAGGGVALVDPAPLAQELAAVPAEERVLVLARNGIWYDAVDTLSRRIESAPADPVARQQLAALLEQVGLSDIAAGESAGSAR